MFRFHCYLRFCTPSLAVLVLYFFLYGLFTVIYTSFLHSILARILYSFCLVYESIILHAVFFGLLLSVLVALVTVSS